MKNRTEQDDGRIIEVQLDALPIFEVKWRIGWIIPYWKIQYEKHEFFYTA